MKNLEDAVWRGLGRDDVTIAEEHIYRCGPDRANPRVELVIETLLLVVEG